MGLRLLPSILLVTRPAILRALLCSVRIRKQVGRIVVVGVDNGVGHLPSVDNDVCLLLPMGLFACLLPGVCCLLAYLPAVLATILRGVRLPRRCLLSLDSTASLPMGHDGCLLLCLPASCCGSQPVGSVGWGNGGWHGVVVVVVSHSPP